MHKRRKKSSQKQFIQTMVITGVVGLSVMMIVTLYMIKLFGEKKAQVMPDPLTPISKNTSKQDVTSYSTQGVVHTIGSKVNNIQIWDIQTNDYIKLAIKDKTQVQDQYAKAISKQAIELGDLVDVTYEAQSKDIQIIQISPKSWQLFNVIKPKIHDENKTITIGNRTYDYNKDVLVINDQSQILDIGSINQFDSLTIKGINNTIWAIKVVEAAAYVRLSNMPSPQGRIEIGNNQIYNLEEIQENISLPAGSHKIVVHMEGYQPFVDQVNLEAGQTYDLDLKQAQEAISKLKVQVINTQVDYKLTINEKTYSKGEVIDIKPGDYILKIRADGYKNFEMKVKIEDRDQSINIRLEKEQEEEPEEAPKAKPEDTRPKPEEEIKTVQIVIETDPTDAQVFVGGVYKGTTPALTGLKPGEYSISIEKEGYSTLYSTIIIDASNAQKGFLYTLQKE